MVMVKCCVQRIHIRGYLEFPEQELLTNCQRKASARRNVNGNSDEMLRLIPFLSLSLFLMSASAAVRVYVEDISGKAYIKYACTEGEVVRSFGLDVTVSQGTILGVTNFFRGESSSSARGYGIFPASFRDQITISSGTNANWSVTGYTPLAVVADQPTDTKPGLGSSGVTLEFGALWNINDPASVPDPAGTLCALQLSQPASVTISANQARGGVVSATADAVIVPVFESAVVDPSVIITGIKLTNGVVTITFKGGELEQCTNLGTAWNGTGNRSGIYSEPVSTGNSRFFRVKGE